MMTSVLLIDVQGFETLAKGQADPAALIQDLSDTMHGVTRQIAVMRAYCSPRVSTSRRSAYREAGFEVVETGTSDETLILMTLDLASLSHGDTMYEEAMILGGTTDYTGLARLARERLMMVSVVDHDGLPASLEALADGMVDVDDLPIDRSRPSATPAPVFTPPPTYKPEDKSADAPVEADEPKEAAADEPKAEPKGKQNGAAQNKDEHDNDEQDDDTKGDPWPKEKTGTILVAGAATAGAAGLAAANVTTAGSAKPSFIKPLVGKTKQVEPKAPAEPKAPVEPEVQAEPTLDAKAPAVELAEPAPAVDAQLEDAIAASLSDDLDIDLSEDTTKTSDGETPKVEPVVADDKAEPDDSSIDALFADLKPDDLAPSIDTPAPVASSASLGSASLGSASLASATEPAALTKMASANADADVDELLTRLMSEDLATEPAGDMKEVALDVVPER